MTTNAELWNRLLSYARLVGRIEQILETDHLAPEAKLSCIQELLAQHDAGRALPRFLVGPDGK